MIITGKNFGTDINAVTLKFSNSATVKSTSITPTQITIAVPSDAITGAITVTINGNTPVVTAATSYNMSY